MFGGFKGSFLDNYLIKKINNITNQLTSVSSKADNALPKANISNLQNVTEKGNYAMDAVEANPSVNGSLANKIDSLNTNLINKIYPVGSIYMSVNNISPSNFIGGNWEPLRDRFLIGAGSGYGVNTTGGATTHTLSAGELPAYFPSTHNFIVDGGITSEVQMGISMGYAPAGPYKAIISSIQRGGGQPHNNMPPYLAVYMWKRIS